MIHSRSGVRHVTAFAPDSISHDALDQEWDKRLDRGVCEPHRSLPAPPRDLGFPRHIVAALAASEFRGDLHDPVP